MREQGREGVRETIVSMLDASVERYPSLSSSNCTTKHCQKKAPRTDEQKLEARKRGKSARKEARKRG
jgi:hypothetical protein